MTGKNDDTRINEYKLIPVVDDDKYSMDRNVYVLVNQDKQYHYFLFSLNKEEMRSIYSFSFVLNIDQFEWWD
jgi:hypothetical protein